MFRGYNFSVSESHFERYQAHGQRIHATNKTKVQSVLKSFEDANGNLIASKITASWFPGIRSDVFISHSHKDSDLAIGFSGFLSHHFKIESFIDSCVWGYSEDLLKLLDDEYCLREGGKLYDYKKRNRSTSHVHMMLSIAIAQMMNNCECIIFLNTPASISSENYINDDSTESPWIYSEIAMTSLIQKRSLADHRLTEGMEALAKKMTILYDVDLSHLTDLDKNDIDRWQKNARGLSGAEALNCLYGLKKV